MPKSLFEITALINQHLYNAEIYADRGEMDSAKQELYITEGLMRSLRNSELTKKITLPFMAVSKKTYSEVNKDGCKV